MQILYIVNADKFIKRDYFIKLIAKELELREFSPSQSISEHILNRTEFGLELETKLASGTLLDTDIIEKLITLIFTEHDFILLEYYPRTQEQLDSLKKVLLKNNIELKRCMYLRNKNAINFGHIEIDERELVTIDFTESTKIDENKFKSLIRSFA